MEEDSVISKFSVLNLNPTDFKFEFLHGKTRHVQTKRHHCGMGTGTEEGENKSRWNHEIKIT